MSAELNATAPVWTGEDDNILVCQRVRQETADVKTFVFAPRTPHRFSYLPGQFLTFELEIGGETIYRSYTISSAPSRPYTVSITVKRVPGGPVSNWLHDTLKPGDEVKAAGPMGEFTAFPQPAAKLLLLSGGSGITPSLSMVRSLYDLGMVRDVVFVHSARTPADIICRAELQEYARTVPNFRFVAVCEADAPGEAWGGFRGRLSLSVLSNAVPDLLEREVYTCGPAPYMAAVRGILDEAGFDRAHYHEESFDFATMMAAEGHPVEEVAPTAAAVETFTVEFTRIRKTITCDSNTTVLEAARQAGIRLASSCARGICGTCKSKKISGEVDMQHGGGIRQKEIDQGMVLLCCSKPRSDLVVER